MRLAAFPALLFLVTACRDSPVRDAALSRRSDAVRDSAFAGVQARGAHAMGVDQYTSTHIFEPLVGSSYSEIKQTVPGPAKFGSTCTTSRRPSARAISPSPGSSTPATCRAPQ
jgi:hypothetical protein